MKNLFLQFYNGVMDAEWNPLRAIPSLALRHLIMQLLSWMWCIIFASIVGSWYFFGLSAIAHSLLLAGVAITVGTFESTASKYDVKRRL